MLTCGIFIDLKKAFDTVNLKMLLDNLNYYRFRGVVYECFKSYWSDRAQTTSIDSYISAKFTCPCGVPQVNCKQTPPNNLNLFCRTSSIHRYSTRSSTSLNFYTQHSRTDLQKNALSRFGTRAWNEKPELIKKNKHVKSNYNVPTMKLSSFCSNKDPNPMYRKSHVIYKLTCPTCNVEYIGKTDRCLRVRLDQHSSDHNSAMF